MKPYYILLCIVLKLNTSYAQGDLFVTAENGLNVRETAAIDAPKKGKFYYADRVFQLLPVKDSITIQENGEAVKGTWMLVSGTNEKQENIQGYVFSGFLTDQFIHKPVPIIFKEGSVTLYNTYGYWNENTNIENKIALIYGYELGYTDGIEIKATFPEARKIEIFQRLDASITYNIHDIDCEVLRQGIVKSEWEVLTKKNNRFFIKNYTNEPEGQEILKIKAWRQLKENIKSNCLESYYQIHKGFQKRNQDMLSITPNFVSFKIVITNEDGSQTIERIDFQFEEMGC